MANFTEVPVSVSSHPLVVGKTTVGDVFRKVDSTAATVVQINKELLDAETAHKDAVAVVDTVLDKHEFALIDGKVYKRDKDALAGYAVVTPATEDTVID